MSQEEEKNPRIVDNVDDEETDNSSLLPSSMPKLPWWAWTLLFLGFYGFLVLTGLMTANISNCSNDSQIPSTTSNTTTPQQNDATGTAFTISPIIIHTTGRGGECYKITFNSIGLVFQGDSARDAGAAWASIKTSIHEKILSILEHIPAHVFMNADTLDTLAKPVIMDAANREVKEFVDVNIHDLWYIHDKKIETSRCPEDGERKQRLHEFIDEQWADQNERS